MDIRSYWLPTLLATLLHVVVLGALLNHWIGDVRPEPRTMPHIQARMIDLDALGQQVAQPTPASKPDTRESERKAAQENAAKERAAQEKQRQEVEAKRQQEVQREKAEEAQKQKRLAEQQKQKAEAEAKRKQAEIAARKKAEEQAKKRAEEAAQKQAQAKRQAQEKAKAEAAAKAKSEAAAKAKAEADAKARADAEAKAQQARAAAQQRAESVVGDIQGYIQALIERNWRVPKTARNGMEAVVAIRLLGNGEVDQASIYRSSGDAAFDQSALQAVYRTERFERVAEVDPILFERRLRSIHIVFRPEGLRW